MGEFNTFKIFSHFVKAAFLPTVVAVPLTVGFIMISAGIQAPCPARFVNTPLCLGGGFQIFPGINNTWVMVWNILAIIVIWLGFFYALKIDSIYYQTGQWFKKAGEGLAKLPLAMPILPGAVLGGDKDSKFAVSDVIGGLKNPAGVAAGSGSFIDRLKQASGRGGTKGPKPISAGERDRINKRHADMFKQVLADNKGDTKKTAQTIIIKLNAAQDKLSTDAIMDHLEIYQKDNIKDIRTSLRAALDHARKNN